MHISNCFCREKKLSFFNYFVLFCTGLEVQLQIQKPYHPYYIKAGTTLVITCNSTGRRQLEWLQETPAGRWNEIVINPQPGSDYKTRYTIEEPTGNVESMLLKHHMTVFDRGTYRCRDSTQENSYAIWVAVLQCRFLYFFLILQILS